MNRAAGFLRFPGGALVRNLEEVASLDPDGELAALGLIADSAARGSEEASFLESILLCGGELVGTSHAWACVVDEEDGGLVVLAGTGVFAQSVGDRRPPSRGLAQRVIDLGRPLVVDDYSAWPDRSSEGEGLGLGAVTGVPLFTADRVGGAIVFAHLGGEERFVEQQIGAIVRIARLAALGLENARLTKAAQAEARERRRMEEELLDTISWLNRSQEDLRRSHVETIERLASAAEFRSRETGDHLKRMSRYCADLARRLGLDEDRVELISIASALHDIGKIAVPDRILLKEGPLTSSERELMETHAEIGHRLLSGSDSEVLKLAATIALTHHENYDGTGYPRGLSGEMIPLEGRIAAVADVYDALRSDRVYRAAVSTEEALAVMALGRGQQFDPLVLDLLFESIEQARPRGARSWRPHAVQGNAGALRRPASKRSKAVGSIALDPVRDACRAALEVLDAIGPERDAIDLAVARFAKGWDGALIISVYVLEYERLWVIAQRGYRDVVHDGFLLDQGVMARAVRTGAVQLVPDVAADPDYIGAADGVVAEIALPFGPADAPVGVLNIETLHAGLPQGVETTLAPLADAFAARVESMRFGLGLDVASLTRLCVHASSLRDVPALAEFATRTFGRLLELESAQLVLHRDNDRTRLASHWRRPESRIPPLSVEQLRTFDRVRADDRSVESFGILQAQTLGLTEDGAHAPWVAWLPLRLAGNEIGCLIGRSRERELEHARVEAAALVGQHVSALIDVAQRFRREQRAAVTDQLTGLLNRRGFEERFRDALDRAHAQDESLCLIMLDCDGLKAINDAEGHERGDAALRQVAGCLRENKRVSDVAARVGGDEFVVLLTGIEPEAASEVANRIRAGLSAEPGPSSRPLTASFGLAVFPRDGETATALLAAADRALYRAKREGGDRVLVAA